MDGEKQNWLRTSVIAPHERNCPKIRPRTQNCLTDRQIWFNFCTEAIAFNELSNHQLPNRPQSILQTVERDTPFFLEFVNAELNNIFGPTTSFFINTTPRKFLFEGVEFCRSPVGLPQIVCNQVLERNSPSIIKSPDGAALVFSMFNHVSWQNYGARGVLWPFSIVEKPHTRWALRDQYGCQTD